MPAYILAEAEKQVSLLKLADTLNLAVQTQINCKHPHKFELCYSLLKKFTFMIATRTRVACVVVLVIDLPLKSLLSAFVLIATPNLDRIALELWERKFKLKYKVVLDFYKISLNTSQSATIKISALLTVKSFLGLLHY